MVQSISAKIVELSNEEIRKIAITENIQREDLTRVEEAFAFKKFVDQGLQQKEVGDIFGNMQNRVAERLKFLSSHYYIQFQEQRISELEAKLASLNHEREADP